MTWVLAVARAAVGAAAAAVLWCADLTRNFVVGPIAKFIANKISEGDTLSNIAARTGIDGKLVEKAVKEVQGRVFLFLYNQDGGSIAYSDLREQFVDALKYELVPF